MLTLPIAGIIASITAFGRLSLDKELVAMRAAGFSLLRLSQAVFLFAALVCGLTLIMAQYGQPWSNVNLRRWRSTCCVMNSCWNSIAASSMKPSPRW